jgi:2-polyprenyl-3-methyl-5-hydroxy-6-metoxy-1,4-benzoquinol methylase
MKAWLTPLLRCPDCGRTLNAEAEEGEADEIVEGRLICESGHEHPVRGGVARFVSGDSYAENFGFEWTLHSRTQLDTETSRVSEEEFRQKTGFTPDELRGRLVLDAGCGMGRFSDVAARWGARVVGVDLTRAVDSAYANVGSHPTVSFAQADLFRLPFCPETFDFVFSIGVLHHTPDTRAAFDRLPALVKPGGKIAVWLYHRYDSVPAYMSDVWRRLTVRMSPRALHRASHIARPLYHIWRLPRLGLLPRALLPISLNPRPEWRVLDTYDWYSPKYQWKYTYEEVYPWFEAQGLTDIRVLGAPVALQGTRPKPRRRR